MLNPCEILKLIPIVSDCAATGDTIRLSLTDDLFKSTAVYTILERSPTKIALALEYLVEGEPKARMSELWMYMEERNLVIDYKLEAGFRVRGQASRNLDTSIQALRGVIPIVCSRVEAHPAEAPEEGKERAKETGPAVAVKAAPQPEYKYDLSDTRFRARLVREAKSFKLLPTDVKLEEIIASELKTGAWLVLEAFPSGRKYTLVENGIVQGVYCERECRGEPLTVIAYEIALG
jgi:hypothetical protein